MDDTALLTDFAAFVRGVTGLEPPAGLLTEALEIAKSWEKGAIGDYSRGSTGIFGDLKDGDEFWLSTGGGSWLPDKWIKIGHDSATNGQRTIGVSQWTKVSTDSSRPGTTKGDAWAIPDDNGGNTTKESEEDHTKGGAGTPPASFSQEALRHADFVTLPDDVEGTNCGNCRHQARGVCHFYEEGTDLRGLRVTVRDCCAEWDARGTERVWLKPAKSARPPWYVEKRQGPFDYSAALLMVEDALPASIVVQGPPDILKPTGDIVGKLRAMAAAIPDGDLAEDGREDEFHITAKYGLMTSDPEEVRHYARSFGRVRATLGKTAYFPAGDGGEADVVYVEVAGNGARDLNVLLDGSVPNEDTYPTYTPHVTLAYVRPGLGAKYVGLTDVEGVDLEWDTLTFSTPGGDRAKIRLDDPDAPAEEDRDPDRLLELPDIRQQDNYSCGAACAMAVGRYFSVGPGSLDEWKRALGTTEETSTLPQAVVAYLRSLGLSADPCNDLTLEDLTRAWRQGKPVICCVQEYGVPSKQASYKYGHYVVVIGRSLGHVFVQDPSADNALGRPGGSQGAEGTVHEVDDMSRRVVDPDSLAAPGRNMIREADFLRVWHDEDVLSNKYESFGIIVGPPLHERLGLQPRCEYPEAETRRPVSVLGTSAPRSFLKSHLPVAKGPAGYQVLQMEGQRRSGSERGGVLWHAVPPAPYPNVNRALCGKQPGLRSNWVYQEGQQVTCPPCLRKLGATKSVAKGPALDTVQAAGTCKPGQTAEATGCTPASGGGGGGGKGRATPSGETAAGAGVGKKVVETFGRAAAKYADAKAAAKRFGGAGFAKLPPKAQKALTKLWGWTKYVEHKVMTGFTKAKELARLAAKERGLSDEQAEKIAKVLGIVDAVTAWTVNMPVTAAVTGSMTAAKVSSWVPVASLAYLAYSTARNPLATARAAKKLVKTPKHKGKKAMDKKQLAGVLAARAESLGKTWDWYLALFSAAMDEHKDPAKALAAADAAYKKQPAPPDEAALSEEDVAQFDLGAN